MGNVACKLKTQQREKKTPSSSAKVSKHFHAYLSNQKKKLNHFMHICVKPKATFSCKLTSNRKLNLFMLILTKQGLAKTKQGPLPYPLLARQQSPMQSQISTCRNQHDKDMEEKRKTEAKTKTTCTFQKREGKGEGGKR